MSSMPFDAATVEAIKTLELPTPKIPYWSRRIKFHHRRGGKREITGNGQRPRIMFECTDV